MTKIERNKPCPCGSGKKYKKCCFVDKNRNAELLRALKVTSEPSEIKKILSEPLQIYELKVTLIQMAFNDVVAEVSRILEVSAKATLYDVHLEIQNAFNWDNDHMFSFYVGADTNDRENEYSANPLGVHVVPGFGKPTKSASDTEVRDINLQKGMEFSYLFDYGSEIWHKIVVVSVKASSTENPQLTNLISETGEAPDQYDY